MAAGCGSGSPRESWVLAFVPKMGELEMCTALPKMHKGCKLVSETQQPASAIFSSNYWQAGAMQHHPGGWFEIH